jgi:hypothetical protein
MISLLPHLRFVGWPSVCIIRFLCTFGALSEKKSLPLVFLDIGMSVAEVECTFLFQ